MAKIKTKKTVKKHGVKIDIVDKPWDVHIDNLARVEKIYRETDDLNAILVTVAQANLVQLFQISTLLAEIADELHLANGKRKKK